LEEIIGEISKESAGGDRLQVFQPSSAERILVVDDDESICRTMQMIFNAYGYDTIFVQSGGDALESLKHNQYSLAIVDSWLPDMPGTELIGRIAEISPDIGIIMITGHASVENAVESMTLGAIAYIVKPLDMQEVLKTVSAVIEKQKLIQEKSRAEDALRRSEIWFRNIFKDSPIAINVFDEEGNFVDANQACLDFAGVLNVEDLKKFNIFDDPNLSEEIKTRLRNGESVVFESSVDFNKVRALNQYKSTRMNIAYVESAISPLVMDEKGDVQGYLVQMLDITERKLAEQNVKNQRDKAELYLDLMGHDIRNKLQAVNLGLEIIETLLHNEASHEVFSDVLTAVERCSQIIAMVKKTEKLEEAPLVPIDFINEMRRDVERFAANNSAVDIQIHNSAAEGKVNADQFIDDMVFSLLENAVVHNDNKTKKVWIDVEQSNGNFVLSISDNGPGIDDERRKFLFDRTRRFGGVGLHQVKQIVDKYHGRIEVMDRVAGSQREGAMFRIWLPVYHG
jgi:PAS domain S-box-containing protein